MLDMDGTKGDGAGVANNPVEGSTERELGTLMRAVGMLEALWQCLRG